MSVAIDVGVLSLEEADVGRGEGGRHRHHVGRTYVPREDDLGAQGEIEAVLVAHVHAQVGRRVRGQRRVHTLHLLSAGLGRRSNNTLRRSSSRTRLGGQGGRRERTGHFMAMWWRARTKT